MGTYGLLDQVARASALFALPPFKRAHLFKLRTGNDRSKLSSHLMTSRGRLVSVAMPIWSVPGGLTLVLMRAARRAEPAAQAAPAQVC